MSRLTNIDRVCREHVDKLAGSGDRRMVAVDLARQARSFEYQDRDRAATASHVLMTSISNEVGGKSLSKKDATALVGEIKKHVRSAYQYKSFAIAYRRYAEALSDRV